MFTGHRAREDKMTETIGTRLLDDQEVVELTELIRELLEHHTDDEATYTVLVELLNKRQEDDPVRLLTGVDVLHVAQALKYGLGEYIWKIDGKCGELVEDYQMKSDSTIALIAVQDRKHSESPIHLPAVVAP